jgi:hypothetical protein
MDDHSFLSIESKAFHNLIHLLHKDVLIPSADTIKKEIINTFNNGIKEIRKVLQVCKLFFIFFLLLLNVKFL